MFRFVWLFFGMLDASFADGKVSFSRISLCVNSSVALKRRHPRPSLRLFDQLFWVVARRVWSAWKQSLILVTPETVVRWHRTGFRMYWGERTISRWMKRAPRDPDRTKRWLVFLRNHREAIAAMDFFTAPTITFRVWRSHAEKLAARLQLLLAVSIAEESVVANTVEPTR